MRQSAAVNIQTFAKTAGFSRSSAQSCEEGPSSPLLDAKLAGQSLNIVRGAADPPCRQSDVVAGADAPGTVA